MVSPFIGYAILLLGISPIYRVAVLANAFATKEDANMMQPPLVSQFNFPMSDFVQTSLTRVHTMIGFQCQSLLA